jgi:hypothetical protein
MINNLNGSQRFVLPYHQWLGATQGNRSTRKDLPTQDEVEQVFDEWVQKTHNSGVSREQPGPSRLAMSKKHRRPIIEGPLTQANMKRLQRKQRYKAAASMVSIVPQQPDLPSGY